MTKLEAVNLCLDAIGEVPVNSLESNLDDAADAERFLDRVSKEVQSMGWLVNTEDRVEMTPDDNKQIPIPTAALRADASSFSSKYRKVTVRNVSGVPYLYDLKNRTFQFDAPIEITYVWYLDWEDLSYQLQNYIAHHAAVKFQRSAYSSVAVDRMLQQEAALAWIDLMDAEAEQGDYNALRDNYFTVHTTSRYNRLYGR